MDFAREQAEVSALPKNFGQQEELSCLRKAYLGRLRRLLQLRSDHHDDLNEQGLWLLDRSVYTTYCDCVDLGVAFIAQDIIRRHSPERGEWTHPALGHTGDPTGRRQL